MRIFCALFIYCILIVILSVNHNFGVFADSVTPSLTETQFMSSGIFQAIDKGMSDVVSSSAWISLFQSLSIPFQVPSCIERTTNYPNSNPFPSTKTQLNICYEEPTEVWRIFYKQAGDMLVSTLNSRYSGAKLKANHIVINTTVLGYFDTLKRAVDSGMCDVVTSNTIYSQERAEKINFNCGYGSSSMAILLSNKAAYLNYSSVQEFQKASNSSIAVLKGSFFESLGRTTFPKAAILNKENYDDIFEDVMNESVDGTIADAIDLIYWLNNHKQNCSRCIIRLFGDTYRYGSFVTKNVSGASGLFNSSSCIGFVVMLIGMLVLLMTC